MLIKQFQYFLGPYCILSDERPIQSLVIYACDYNVLSLLIGSIFRTVILVSIFETINSLVKGAHAPIFLEGEREARSIFIMGAGLGASINRGLWAMMDYIM